MSDLLNRAMQRISVEDFAKAENAIAAEYREGIDKIVTQAKAMMDTESPYAITGIACSECEQRDPNCLRCTGQLGNFRKV